MKQQYNLKPLITFAGPEFIASDGIARLSILTIEIIYYIK